jgi:hypothetical protein
MNISDEERYRALKSKHQQLYADWKHNNGPCIICGEEDGDEKDHLPPKVLYPKELRNDKTYFFTFPVCSDCNRGSSDEDFLFSVLLSFGLNQNAYLKNEEPTDPDLLALHEQTKGHFQGSSLAKHRQKLLQGYIGKDPATGRDRINIDKLPTNRTLTKIVKSIYWLHTGGDILQRYNPGWWIIPAVDASKEKFIEKHLKISHSDIHWEDKFISHYSIGLPKSGADGFISCSLHFYYKKSVRKGMSWYLIASPVNTKINNKSLFDICASSFGDPTIAPAK